MHNLQRLVNEHVYDQISAFRMIEEDKQTPVNQPGPLLKILQGWPKRL